MRKLMFAAFAALLSTTAHATLQLSISANGSTFTCSDGELSCDQSGAAKNLLTIDTTVGGAFVQITLAQSTFGSPDELQLSSSNILNLSGAPITIKLLASDTGFIPTVTAINESASLTFNSAVGSSTSILQFWADPLNRQGANPTNTPGALLFTATGTPITDPDSFDGTNATTILLSAPFSMTEGASLNLIAGGSVTGFNESMQAIPEPSTWAMMMVGFAGLAWAGLRRGKRARFAL